MTEYERGFVEKCAERGLSERQAGALCKAAYFWQHTTADPLAMMAGAGTGALAGTVAAPGLGTAVGAAAGALGGIGTYHRQGGRNVATYTGAQQADADFLAGLGIDPNSQEAKNYHQWMDDNYGKPGQGRFTRWWRRNFWSDKAQRLKAREEREEGQQRWLEAMEGRRLTQESNKRMYNRSLGIKEKRPGMDTADSILNRAGYSTGSTSPAPYSSGPFSGTGNTTGYHWDGGRITWT